MTDQISPVTARDELIKRLVGRADAHDKMCFGSPMGLGYFSGNDARLLRDAADLLRGVAQQEPTLLRQAEECMKDWLNYAEAHLSEFDVEDGDCHEEKLCPKCEGSGCIQYKIRETRHVLAALAVSSTDCEGK